MRKNRTMWCVPVDSFALLQGGTGGFMKKYMVDVFFAGNGVAVKHLNHPLRPFPVLLLLLVFRQCMGDGSVMNGIFQHSWQCHGFQGLQQPYQCRGAHLFAHLFAHSFAHSFRQPVRGSVGPRRQVLGTGEHGVGNGFRISGFVRVVQCDVVLCLDQVWSVGAFVGERGQSQSNRFSNCFTKCGHGWWIEGVVD